MTTISGKNITIIQSISDAYTQKCSGRGKGKPQCTYKKRTRSVISIYQNAAQSSADRKRCMLERSMIARTSMQPKHAIPRLLLDMSWTLYLIGGSISDRYTSMVESGLKLFRETLKSRARLVSCVHIDAYHATVRGNRISVRAIGRPCTASDIMSYMRKSPTIRQWYESRVVDSGRKIKRYFTEGVSKKKK